MALTQSPRPKDGVCIVGAGLLALGFARPAPSRLLLETVVLPGTTHYSGGTAQDFNLIPF